MNNTSTGDGGGRRLALPRRMITYPVVASLVAVMVGGVPARAAEAYTPLKTQVDASVPAAVSHPGPGPAPARTGKPFTAPAPAWPSAAAAEIEVAPDAGAQAAPATRVGGLPVRVEPADAAAGAPAGATPSRVRIEVLDRAQSRRHGIDGVLLRVGPTGATAGRVRLTVDYTAFRGAYGADWASRLRLLALPDGTSGAAGAAGVSGVSGVDGLPLTEAVPLPSRNNVRAGTVSAEVDVTTSALVAAAAAPSGSSGDFAATTLKPSSTWEAGGNSGGFSWSYPMGTPPSLDGPAPSLALGYASDSVDGRMAASNNQPSWAGEGFEFTPAGSIERRYKACRKDGGNGSGAGTNSGDLCWKTDNALMSLNGETTELILGADGRWHGRTEDGSRIERRTGGANGDNDGEYWVVTTTDGIQYWFGRSRLPGWVSGATETNSTWTVPVYGNQSGEPCRSQVWCQQAWRWNLDYVVDPDGNTMTFWYTAEKNKYARNMSGSSLTEYTRGGYLTRIDYGTRGSTAYGTAPMQVAIGTGDRCLSGCTTHDAAHWPDTPWDQQCVDTSCLIGSPTFWTTRRLGTVTTRVWTGSGTTYRDVERWTFTHSFPDPGDTTRAGLWLDRVAHAGLIGGSTTVPDVTFVGVQMPNRVDATDLAPAMNWWRISTINTESGNAIGIGYSPADCVKDVRMPAAPESNTLRCYPVKWKPQGNPSTITDYFHKYLVTQVTETDLALPSDARSTRAITRYDYSRSQPAWHYTDDDGLIDEEDKTWSVWRGYDRVITTEGDPGEQTSVETLFYQGMNGDKLPSGSRSATVQASEGPAVPDDDAYAGMVRETITYNGPNGAVVSGTIFEPWQSAATATRTRNNVTVSARYIDVGSESKRVALDGGRGWQRGTTRSTFDEYGMEIKEEDLGDAARNDDQRCTLTTYVRDSTAWLMEFPSRVRKFGVDCTVAAGTSVTEADVISDEYTSYDQQARGVAPTKGAVSRTETLSAFPNTYITTSRASHDSYGRVTSQWDVRDNLTTTAYTQAGTSGPVTSMRQTQYQGPNVVTGSGWSTTTSLEPAWGAKTTVVDPNGKRTDASYDGLGRVTGVWYPGRSKADGAAANVITGYTVSNTGPTVVTTQKLNPNGGYTTSYAFFDAQLRARQTQKPDIPAVGQPQGRVITDTLYDSVGRAVKNNDEYVADGAPSTELFPTPSDALVPEQTITYYDGAGRPTDSVYLLKGVEQWRTNTAYGGDRTDVTPPAGSTATSVVLDADGRQVAMRQYAAPTPTGTYDETTYTYNRKGQLATVTDPMGNRWDFTYDLLGRKKSTDDPDKGLSSSTYNDAGDLLTTTDARGEVLAYTYDLFGRKTTLRDDSATGPVRAEWSYDTLATDTAITGPSAKGKLVKTTRWTGTDAYVDETTGFDDNYRPTGRKITIPAVPATTGVSGTYSHTYTYKVDGSPATVRLPGVGGLPTETLSYGYNSLGLPTTLGTNVSASGDDTFYVTGTSYTRYGEVGTVSRRYDGGKLLQTGSYYEAGTRRLDRLLTTRETVPSVVADVSYGWDESGNVIRSSDAASSDTQCFRYDHLRRLTEAWTPSTGDCGPAPTQAGLGGPGPYWQSFGYDKVGNRKTLTDRTATTSTSRTYNYPAALADRPHAVSSTVTGLSTASYTYDETGNTRTRPSNSGTQTLTWDAEGHLATSSDGGGTTSYLYDAEGNRLMRTDPGGKTLYLGGQELRFTASTSTAAGTRYYEHGEQTIAMRDARGVTWLVNDRQGTAQASLDAVTQAVTVRRQKPFGEARGSASSWPNDKGFVGGTNDNTGLVHLGAREYDAANGRFVSVDPVLEPNDPQQLNAYAYSNNSPVTFSDPSGLFCVLCFIAAVIRIARAVIRYVRSHVAAPARTSSGGHRRHPPGWRAKGGYGSTSGAAYKGGRPAPIPAPPPKPKPHVVDSPTPSPSPGVSPRPCNACGGGILDFMILLAIRIAAANARYLAESAKEAGRTIVKGVNTVGQAGTKAQGAVAGFVWNQAWRGGQNVAALAGLATPMPVRRLEAAAVGLGAEGIARLGGATCSSQQGLRVCQGGRGWLSSKGGTTYGHTFVQAEAGPVDAELAKHERVHTRQWQTYGASFGIMYLMESARTLNNGCHNTYEQAAGLNDGNYRNC